MRTTLRLVIVAGLLLSGRLLQAQALTVLHSFTGQPSDGDFSRAGLVQGSDGSFYGTTRLGGVNDDGCVFKMDASGAVTLLYSFSGGSDGANPQASLIQASDGLFYGTTQFGGVNGSGTVFKIDSSGAFTSLHSFDGTDGRQPLSPLVEGTDGNFYGTTYLGGTNNNGAVFQMTPSGTVTRLHSFGAGNPAGRPGAGLIQAADGVFYGTTVFGGANAMGSVFKITSSGTFTQLHSFNGTKGAQPSAPLLQASDGNFYGTTVVGGSNNSGVIFEIDSTGNFNVLHNMPISAFPNAGLIQLADGYLYGTTYEAGAHGLGSIFEVNPADGSSYTRLFSFSGSDGANPWAPLVQGTDGNLYGTTTEGGAAGKGGIFSFCAPTVLHSFTGQPSDGEAPQALIQGTDGNFYGTTFFGGLHDEGSVLKMDASGTVTLLYSFARYEDGANPLTSLVQASGGFFYGTTTQGGPYNDGVAFKIDSSGTFTNLHSFNGTDGEIPSALVEGTDGNFYGTTYFGGAHGSGRGAGTVFKMKPAGTVTTLHSFRAEAHPHAGLIQASDGLFYGTTTAGGANAMGSIFKITSSGTFTQLHSFNGNDGSNPNGPLFQAIDGNFYGTTVDGGSHGAGVIFKFDSAGNYTVMVNLANDAHPGTGLIQLPNGLLYGTTSSGGTSHDGEIFTVNPSTGDYTRIFSFSGSNGSTPNSALLLGSDGKLYGTTFSGGGANLGVAFSICPAEVNLADVPTSDR